MPHHDFAFTRAYRLAGLPFGVTPGTTGVDVDQGMLRVRFGPWRLQTEVANVEGVEESGDYAFLKTAGPRLPAPLPRTRALTGWWERQHTA